MLHVWSSTPTTHLNGKKAVFLQALRYNLLIADDNILQKELVSLTISLLARKYPLEVITCNITKVLLHSCYTLLYRTPKTSSSRSVLPLIGRKTTNQVSSRPLAYHWEWSTTTQHLAQSLHHCLPQNWILKGHPSTFQPSQTNISTFCSQQMLSINTTDTLKIIMRPYPSQPTPFFDKGDRLFQEPKAHLYVIAVTYFMVFDTMSHPLFFRVTKIRYTKPREFRHEQ